MNECVDAPYRALMSARGTNVYTSCTESAIAGESLSIRTNIYLKMCQNVASVMTMLAIASYSQVRLIDDLQSFTCTCCMVYSIQWLLR